MNFINSRLKQNSMEEDFPLEFFYNLFIMLIYLMTRIFLK